MNDEKKFPSLEFQDIDEPTEVSESTDELIPVAVCYDWAEAESIKKLLEGRDLQVVATSWDGLEIEDLTPYLEKGVNLNVFTEDGYEATMLLEGFRAGQEASGALEIDNGWGNCPKCQSKNLVIISDVRFGKAIWDFATTLSARRALHCNDCGCEWETGKS